MLELCKNMIGAWAVDRGLSLRLLLVCLLLLLFMLWFSSKLLLRVTLLMCATCDAAAVPPPIDVDARSLSEHPLSIVLAQARDTPATCVIDLNAHVSAWRDAGDRLPECGDDDCDCTGTPRHSWCSVYVLLHHMRPAIAVEVPAERDEGTSADDGGVWGVSRTSVAPVCWVIFMFVLH